MCDAALQKLSPSELTDLILQLQAIENVIRRKKLAAIAAYDEKEAWKADGATSMPAWIVGMLGFGRDTANEEARVSRSFEELPEIAATFERGELSWDQASAVTEFATPQTDRHLAAEACKFSASHLRRMARRFKPVDIEVAQDAIDARALRMRWDLKANMLRIKGQLPAAEGALVEKAIHRIIRQVADDIPYAEGPYNHDRLCADALVELASTRISADPDPDRATIGVHVDASVLAGGTGMAEINGANAIAMETARRLSCDSRWYIVIDGPDGLPIGIGRTSRQIPAWLAREIRHRDDGCRWQGCNRKGWISIHHVIPWAQGGRTDLENLVTLCGVHHRLVHECGWKIEGEPNGELRFVAPDGRVYARSPAPLREELRERVDAIVGRQLTRAGPAP